MSRCAICKQGDVRPGTATVTLNRGETTVIIKGVPADVCAACGEYYLSEPVSGVVLERAEEAVARGAEVEILRWVA
jgi:YgiT-type zinc finger domain-containing protein